MKNSTYLEWAHKREYEGHAKTKCDVCKENHSRFTNISTTKFLTGFILTVWSSQI